jgi:hypothetical protein
MEQIFSYQFQSISITLIIFSGLTFVGAGLGFMFWLDFRKRISKGGYVAGLIVLIAGALLGAFFGYEATQPRYFKMMTANYDGIRLEYYLFTNDVLLRWVDIKNIVVQQNRLMINTKQGDAYKSPVVYRGDQGRLLKSVTQFIPSGDRLN